MINTIGDNEIDPSMLAFRIVSRSLVIKMTIYKRRANRSTEKKAQAELNLMTAGYQDHEALTRNTFPWMIELTSREKRKLSTTKWKRMVRDSRSGTRTWRNGDVIKQTKLCSQVCQLFSGKTKLPWIFSTTLQSLSPATKITSRRLTLQKLQCLINLDLYSFHWTSFSQRGLVDHCLKAKWTPLLMPLMERVFH